MRPASHSVRASVSSTRPVFACETARLAPQGAASACRLEGPARKRAHEPVRRLRRQRPQPSSLQPLQQLSRQSSLPLGPCAAAEAGHRQCALGGGCEGGGLATAHGALAVGGVSGRTGAELGPACHVTSYGRTMRSHLRAGSFRLPTALFQHRRRRARQRLHARAPAHVAPGHSPRCCLRAWGAGSRPGGCRKLARCNAVDGCHGSSACLPKRLTLITPPSSQHGERQARVERLPRPARVRRPRSSYRSTCSSTSTLSGGAPRGPASRRRHRATTDRRASSPGSLKPWLAVDGNHLPGLISTTVTRGQAAARDGREARQRARPQAQLHRLALRPGFPCRSHSSAGQHALHVVDLHHLRAGLMRMPPLDPEASPGAGSAHRRLRSG